MVQEQDGVQAEENESVATIRIDRRILKEPEENGRRLSQDDKRQRNEQDGYSHWPVVAAEVLFETRKRSWYGLRSDYNERIWLFSLAHWILRLGLLFAEKHEDEDVR